jgi:hypothetical protein
MSHQHPACFFLFHINRNLPPLCLNEEKKKSCNCTVLHPHLLQENSKMGQNIHTCAHTHTQSQAPGTLVQLLIKPLTTSPQSPLQPKGVAVNRQHHLSNWRAPQVAPLYWTGLTESQV